MSTPDLTELPFGDTADFAAVERGLIRWDLPDHGVSYRTTLHNGVLTYVKDSAQPASLTLTVPAATLSALAQGDPNFNIVEP